MPPALMGLLGTVLVVSLIAAFAGEAIAGVLGGMDSPIGQATAFAAAGLAAALWLYQLVRLVRGGWLWRAWFVWLLWGYGIGMFGESAYRTWWLGRGDTDYLPTIALGLLLGSLVVFVWTSARHLKGGGDQWVERGTRIVDAATAERMLWGKKPEYAAKGNEDLADLLITLGGVHVRPEAETKHFLFSGTTGAGKTQGIQRILDAVRARGGRVLAADSGGEFYSRYSRPGDHLVNPFDGRGVDWSPFAEIRADYDCQRIARSAVPDRDGAGGEWNHYAQVLLAEVLLAMHAAGDHSVRRLLRYLTAADREELAELLGETRPRSWSAAATSACWRRCAASSRRTSGPGATCPIAAPGRCAIGSRTRTPPRGCSPPTATISWRCCAPWSPPGSTWRWSRR